MLPAGDMVMVGAGQYEQASGDKVVAGVDTRGPRGRHAGCLGEEVTTAACKVAQSGHRLVDRHTAHAIRIAVPDSRAH